jgi:hypothetical protein
LPGERTITSQHALMMSLADVPEFLAGHVGFVKGDGHSLLPFFSTAN